MFPVPLHPVVDAIVPPFAFAVTVYVLGVHTAYKFTVTPISSVILEVAYEPPLAISIVVPVLLVFHPHVYPGLVTVGNVPAVAVQCAV